MGSPTVIHRSVLFYEKSIPSTYQSPSRNTAPNKRNTLVDPLRHQLAQYGSTSPQPLPPLLANKLWRASSWYLIRASWGKRRATCKRYFDGKAPVPPKVMGL